MDNELKVNKKSIIDDTPVNYIDPPIVCVLGERGDGKTLVMTALGYLYISVDNLKLFSNYHLYDIPYTFRTFDDVASFPDELRDGVILLDEAHTGLDAFDFFKQRVKDLTVFITQLRKRNLTMIVSTQRFQTLVKRLRRMTNYIIEVNKTKEAGVIQCRTFDLQKEEEESFIKEFMLDGKQFFKMYDTNEIISPSN